MGKNQFIPKRSFRDQGTVLACLVKDLDMEVTRPIMLAVIVSRAIIMEVKATTIVKLVSKERQETVSRVSSSKTERKN